jgi:hypothetical protein
VWRHFGAFPGISNFHPNQPKKKIFEEVGILDWLLVDYWHFAGRDAWIRSGSYFRRTPRPGPTAEEEIKREKEKREKREARMPKWRIRKIPLFPKGGQSLG